MTAYHLIRLVRSIEKGKQEEQRIRGAPLIQARLAKLEDELRDLKNK